MKVKFKFKVYRFLDKILVRPLRGYLQWNACYYNIMNVMETYMSSIREYTHSKKGQDDAEEYLKLVQEHFWMSIISTSDFKKK